MLTSLRYVWLHCRIVGQTAAGYILAAAVMLGIVFAWTLNVTVDPTHLSLSALAGQIEVLGALAFALIFVSGLSPENRGGASEIVFSKPLSTLGFLLIRTAILFVPAAGLLACFTAGYAHFGHASDLWSIYRLALAPGLFLGCIALLCGIVFRGPLPGIGFCLLFWFWSTSLGILYNPLFILPGAAIFRYSPLASDTALWFNKVSLLSVAALLFAAANARLRSLGRTDAPRRPIAARMGRAATAALLVLAYFWTGALYNTRVYASLLPAGVPQLDARSTVDQPFSGAYKNTQQLLKGYGPVPFGSLLGPGATDFFRGIGIGGDTEDPEFLSQRMAALRRAARPGGWRPWRSYAMLELAVAEVMPLPYRHAETGFQVAAGHEAEWLTVWPADADRWWVDHQAAGANLEDGDRIASQLTGSGVAAEIGSEALYVRAFIARSRWDFARADALDRAAIDEYPGTMAALFGVQRAAAKMQASGRHEEAMLMLARVARAVPDAMRENVETGIKQFAKVPSSVQPPTPPGFKLQMHLSVAGSGPLANAFVALVPAAAIPQVAPTGDVANPRGPGVPPADGEPASQRGRELTLTNLLSTQPNLVARSGADGACAWDRVPAGAYVVAVRVGSWQLPGGGASIAAPAANGIVVVAGDMVLPELELKRANTVSTVLTPGGPSLRWAPVPGAARYRVSVRVHPAALQAQGLPPDRWVSASAPIDPYLVWWKDNATGTALTMTPAQFVGPVGDAARSGFFAGVQYEPRVEALDAKGAVLATTESLTAPPVFAPGHWRAIVPVKRSDPQHRAQTDWLSAQIYGTMGRDYASDIDFTSPFFAAIAPGLASNRPRVYASARLPTAPAGQGLPPRAPVAGTPPPPSPGAAPVPGAPPPGLPPPALPGAPPTPGAAPPPIAAAAPGAPPPGNPQPPVVGRPAPAAVPPPVPTVAIRPMPGAAASASAPSSGGPAICFAIESFDSDFAQRWSLRGLQVLSEVDRARGVLIRGDGALVYRPAKGILTLPGARTVVLRYEGELAGAELVLGKNQAIPMTGPPGAGLLIGEIPAGLAAVEISEIRIHAPGDGTRLIGLSASVPPAAPQNHDLPVRARFALSGGKTVLEIWNLTDQVQEVRLENPANKAQRPDVVKVPARAALQADVDPGRYPGAIKLSGNQFALTIQRL